MGIYNSLENKTAKIAVIGLGYVGLPLALEFARHFEVIGFDIDADRIEMMKRGEDPSNELPNSSFTDKNIRFTADRNNLEAANLFIITVPTPVDEHKVPDLSALKAATRSVAAVLKKGDYVVYESTVYPGCTEDDCLPILEQDSGIKLGDFRIGYSPERINPGDKNRTIDTIPKIVGASDEVALEELFKVYSKIIKAGVHKTSSIKVAEAAKVIENTQRDLNISFMNELAIIFDRMKIDTQEVIKAASTKWNFLQFYPGLVGGHCIGVDPYYLTHKAKELGYDPQVILSGRRINDGMPVFVANKLVKLLIKAGKTPQKTKVLIKGVTFKEDITDIRNSKVFDLIKELQQFEIKVDVIDACASKMSVKDIYNIDLVDEIATDYDAVVVAVAHQAYRNLTMDYFKSIMRENPILMDLKAIYEKPTSGITYWRL
ncbi:MAG: UDP-N-acetyl-D-galactosamine dehydrogenase [Saprospiraceae bacterium]|jgi:UDP-N-acetyl-D-galactosamine dehydrogenase